VPAHLGSIEAILNEQLENADVVVLNKIDSQSEDELMRAEELVRKKATKVRFLELAYHAELDTRLCMGLELHDDDEPAAHDHTHHDHHHGPITSMPADLDRPPEDQSVFDGHAHSGLSTHEHDDHTHQHFHEHDVGWQTFVLKSTQPQDAEQLKAAVREVTLRQPILRAKGFAEIAGKPQRLVVQAVRNRVQTYFQNEHAHDSELVFIGYHPNRDAAVEIMARLTGSEWQ
jgi:cobalamin biosynthesis protein CobW